MRDRSSGSAATSLSAARASSRSKSLHHSAATSTSDSTTPISHSPLKLGLEALAPIAIATTDSPSAIRDDASVAFGEVGGVQGEAPLAPQDRRRDKEGRGREEQQPHPARADERGSDAPRLKGATPKMAFAAAPCPLKARRRDAAPPRKDTTTRTRARLRRTPPESPSPSPETPPSRRSGRGASAMSRGHCSSARHNPRTSTRSAPAPAAPAENPSPRRRA